MRYLLQVLGQAATRNIFTWEHLHIWPCTSGKAVMQACLSGFEALMVHVVLESRLACAAVCCWGALGWARVSSSRLLGLLDVMERHLLEGKPQGAGIAPALFLRWTWSPDQPPRVSCLKQTAAKFIQIINISPLLAWWAVRWVFSSARAVCEFCNVCGGLKATINHKGTVLVSGDVGILRGFCTHACKAALGSNCCMQHAISGNLPSSAVMFFDLPWFSDSKLPFPALFRLVHSVFFPFLLSVYSLTLGKAVQCLSVVPSFTQRPSRPVWDCFE